VACTDEQACSGGGKRVWRTAHAVAIFRHRARLWGGVRAFNAGPKEKRIVGSIFLPASGQTLPILRVFAVFISLVWFVFTFKG
jgi:hypothetical protein